MELIKPDLSRCNKLFDDGFSLITVNSQKVPNIRWKEYQTTAMKKDTFENFYNLPSSDGIGIVTGYADLEVIDVDLKVIHTVKEREAFWNEFLTMLRDNIADFETKFVIVKTRNNGYHILYKSKSLAGNVKIAKLQGQQEAVIESRGRGGYVWIYDQFVQGNSYGDVQYITDEERDCLWTVCKMYNHVESTEEIKPKIEHQHYESEIKIWDDFNSKNRIMDLVSSEFTVVKKLDKKTIIKRNGATSPHSGYIFENSKCMYLFSTGTRYPNEKLLTPFHVYAIQKHYGDFSEAAKDLYKQGYGSRIKRQIESTLEVVPVINTNDFPIDIYPDFIQKYITEVSNTLNANLDFLGCGFLWALSLCVGNTIKIEIKKGWQEAAIVWIALVGRAGVGKTHTIKAITNPLERINGREIKRYADEMAKYEAYMALEKKEKALAEEIKKPRKKKFIAEDITIEALTELHENNPNGIGILKDELVGWIKDMNKYREGSDLQKYLSCWSNGILSSDRKTSSSSYVEKSFIPIIGGVQPSILTGVYTAENKENGFIDRILLCYPDIKVEKYNKREMSEKLINEYDDFLTYLYDNIKQQLLRYDEFGNIKPHVFRLSSEAEIEWIRIFDKITDMQNSDEENEYMKSVLPKIKSYIARFALLLDVLYIYSENKEMSEITKRAVLNAEKLGDYFILMAKKNKFQSMEHLEMVETIKYSGKRTAYEKFVAIAEANPKFNKSKVAEELNVSRVTVNNWIKEMNKISK